ncbi:DUF2335 domain-containing protein [Meiothermus sp.]|uniref:DUF2335 domain-containing protein n=1 Tax=Meiothermus sp. TaxID=1955249 RepID=UPI0021DF0AFA|nr:DUF2335 domain-containing protein [Meiothermus sp.]GIW33744.1 MAG: hypothetical protein KatS3mg072_1077 [Meiothermus sp.]
MGKRRKQNLPAKPSQVVNPVSKSPVIGTFSHIQGEINVSPLPKPSDFEGYERVLPGAASRLMEMAEREQRALIELRQQDAQLTKQMMEYDYKSFRAGQWMGLVVTIFSLAAAFVLAYRDNNIAAAGFGVTGLAVLVGVFLRNRFVPNQQEQKNP